MTSRTNKQKEFALRDGLELVFEPGEFDFSKLWYNGMLRDNRQGSSLEFLMAEHAFSKGFTNYDGNEIVVKVLYRDPEWHHREEEEIKFTYSGVNNFLITHLTPDEDQMVICDIVEKEPGQIKFYYEVSYVGSSAYKSVTIMLNIDP